MCQALGWALRLQWGTKVNTVHHFMEFGLVKVTVNKSTVKSE